MDWLRSIFLHLTAYYANHVKSTKAVNFRNYNFINYIANTCSYLQEHMCKQDILSKSKNYYRQNWF